MQTPYQTSSRRHLLPACLHPIQGKDNRKGRPDFAEAPLLRYEEPGSPTAPDFHSQFGEDRILADVFHSRSSGFYVEVGAYNGTTHSNTLYFERRGWRGLLVEADPDLAEDCRRDRPDSTVINCAVVGPGSPPTIQFQVVEGNKFLSSVAVRAEMLHRVDHDQSVRTISVPAKTLDTIFTDAGVTTIDFMTMDVEGQEWSALQGMDLTRWRPRLIILERNSHFPDGRIMRHLHASGYIFARSTGVNDWFEAASAAGATHPTYRVKLFLMYYLPKYLTFFKPAAKNVLAKLGLLNRVANATRRLRGRT